MIQIRNHRHRQDVDSGELADYLRTDQGVGWEALLAALGVVGLEAVASVEGNARSFITAAVVLALVIAGAVAVIG